MHTTKTTTRTTTSTAAAGRVRPAPRTGESVTAVQFGVWGPQPTSVNASSGGGRGGRPYIAVAVGTSLTWVYDRAALDSYLLAWREAEQANRTVRLQELAPAASQTARAGEDLTVGCTVTSVQPSKVTATVGRDGRPVITVTVGAVTVAVHTTSALLSHLHAWTRAATAAGLLDTADDIG